MTESRTAYRSDAARTVRCPGSLTRDFTFPGVANERGTAVCIHCGERMPVRPREGLRQHYVTDIVLGIETSQ